MPPTLDPTAAVRDFIRRWEKSAVERAAEDCRELVRWLRPEFQNPQGSGQTALDTGDETAVVTAPVKVEEVDWPKSMADQAKAVRAALVARGEVLTAEQLAKGFKGARVARVAALLDTRASLGQAREVEEGRYAA